MHRNLVTVSEDESAEKHGVLGNSGYGCKTCRWSSQTPALVLWCGFFERPCYLPCPQYTYEPGTL
jgi:hypothetical protein